MSVDVRGLVFVGTRTPAADAMSVFARDVLGLVPREQGGREQGGTVFFDLPDGSALAVQATEGLEPAERTVGLLVDDLDAAVAELHAAGVATDEVAQTGTQRFVHFRAPDGRLYELVQDRESGCLRPRRRPAMLQPGEHEGGRHMSVRTAVTALLLRRRRARLDAAVASHDAARAPRSGPTTRDVAIGGQTGSTVA